MEEVDFRSSIVDWRRGEGDLRGEVRESLSPRGGEVVRRRGCGEVRRGEVVR